MKTVAGAVAVAGALVALQPVLAQTRSPAYTVRGGTQVAVPFRPEVQADLASARRLAQANDYRTALPIYQMLLASDPADVEMSIEVARVLGFADRNAESAALYRRVVAMAPARRTELLESLAWQTLWGGDAAAAEPMFVELAGMPLTTQQRAGAWRGAAEARQSLGRLDDSLRGYDAAIALAPDDRALQRRRAQMLLWLDRHAESIAAYEALVAADPADRLTQVGLAQALNFSGQHRRALATWTEAGAPVGPDEQREVARGLAWAGFPDMAYGALQDATLPDAVFLRDWRVRREVRPAAWAAYEWSRDRDRLDTRALTLGTQVRLAPARTLEFAWRRFDLSEPAGAARGDRLSAGYAWRIGDPYGRAGTLWPSITLAANQYPGWAPISGAARLRWVPRDLVRIDAEMSREIVETATALANRVSVNTASLGFDLRPVPRVSAGGSASLLRFDDGNLRARVAARADYALRFSPKIVVGLEGQAFRSSDPTSDQRPGRGYWNPRSYHEARAYVGAFHDFQPWEFQGRVGFGVSREVDGFGNSASGTPNVWELALARDFGPGWRGRLFAGGSGSNFGTASGGTGYWRRFAGAGLTGWW
jgi:tetratricopeptide (TPR) repeat protein